MSLLNFKTRGEIQYLWPSSIYISRLSLNAPRHANTQRPFCTQLSRINHRDYSSFVTAAVLHGHFQAVFPRKHSLKSKTPNQSFTDRTSSYLNTERGHYTFLRLISCFTLSLQIMAFC